jgi:D-alanine-D-alanine ligase
MPVRKATKAQKNDSPKEKQIKGAPAEKAGPPKKAKSQPKYPNPTPKLAIDRQALKKIKLVAVAYSQVEREWFPNEEAYEAEREVEDRAMEVVGALDRLGIPARAYPSDQYFLTKLLVDDPNFVLNLVDTLRGKDYLQTSVPGALELANIPYTGAGMRGLVIGNDRNFLKQLLAASEIPTPGFQFVQRKGIRLDEELGLPLIVKLNESGGSVGINNNAVKESLEEAQKQVDEMISTYKMPVIVEKFVSGTEITAVVFDDGQKRHVFLGKKKFNVRPDGKHEFTSIESYDAPNAYEYEPVEDEALAREIEKLCVRAFAALHNKDYSKFDIRVDEETGTPYFTDCNPNTAFGPSMGLPFTEVLETLYGVKFETVLASLMSKYARQIES